MSPARANYDDRLKDYVDVRERIKLFYEKHPDGRLVTGEVRLTNEPDGVPRVMVEAAAYRSPDDKLPGRGWSWMILPGSTPYTRGSEVENVETSAWGRAIGSLGIGIDKSIASRDEIDGKAGEHERPAPAPAATTHDGGLIGTADIGKGDADFNLRQTPDGHAIAFRLVSGRDQIKVMAFSPLADMLGPKRAEVIGSRVTAWGSVGTESWDKVTNGKTTTLTYRVLTLERIKGPTFDLAMPDQEPGPPIAKGQTPLFDDDEQAELDKALATATT